MGLRSYNKESAYKMEIQAKVHLKPAFDHAYSVLVSPRIGILSRVVVEPDAFGTFWTGRATLGHYHKFLRAHPHDYNGFRGGSSFALTKYEAGIAAIGEAIERYSSCFVPRDKIIEASYNELDSDVIHPNDLAMLSPAEYEAHSDTIEQLSSDEPLYWCEGRSLVDNTRVYAPLSFVYSFASPYPWRKSLGPNISSGMAAGPNLKWAALRGICEVVERDAFVITYWNRLPVPEIDLTSASDKTLCELLNNRLPPWFEGQIRVWNLTMDLGIPIILAVVLGENGNPALTCGAAAHVDPQKAATKAITEALDVRAYFLTQNVHSANENNELFVSEPDKVVNRIDHLKMACHPAYRNLIRWLLDSKPTMPFSEIPDLCGETIDEELENAVQAVQSAGLTPSVFDLTTEDINLAGFSTCRVLIPRSQQLSFGRLKRLGGTRLYEVPVKLGYLLKPNAMSGLNPVPHFFP
jgi:ribosomal protein S12 methylthiotransferase accessory factor